MHVYNTLISVDYYYYYNYSDGNIVDGIQMTYECFRNNITQWLYYNYILIDNMLYNSKNHEDTNVNIHTYMYIYINNKVIFSLVGCIIYDIGCTYNVTNVRIFNFWKKKIETKNDIALYIVGHARLFNFNIEIVYRKTERIYELFEHVNGLRNI